MKHLHKLSLYHAPVAAVIFAFFMVTPRAFAQTSDDIAPITPERIKTIPGHGMSQAEYPFNEAGKYVTDWVSTEAKSKVSKSTTHQKPIPYDSPEHPRNQKNQPAPAPAPEPAPVRQFDPEPQEKFTEADKTERAERSIVIASDAEAIKSGFVGPFEKMAPSRGVLANILPAPHSAPARPVAPPAPHSAPARSVVPVVAVASSSPSSDPLYHKVSSGDTLFSISRRYGISVDAIKRSNGLTSDLIKAGQTLRLALAQHALGIVN